ncbi:MAG: hypothetical protein KF858_00845 [Candidatus Sumerlaeia bacterium]|nr:hypothetical protein [Candidatus Sumerlaeia bacterium]
MRRHAAAYFAYADSASARGVAWQPLGSTSVRYPNYLRLQQGSRVRVALGLQRAGMGDLHGALAEADAAARHSDTARASSFLGHLIATAGRQIGYRGFIRLLDEDVDLAVARDATERLASLHESDPAITRALLAYSSLEGPVTLALQRDPAARSFDLPFQNVALSNAIENLLAADVVYADESARRGLQRYFPGGSVSEPLAFYYAPWTRFPAARARVQSVAKAHPEALGPSIFAGTSFGRLPVEQRVFFDYHEATRPAPRVGVNMPAERSVRTSQSWEERMRLGVTNLALAQGAWAARLHHLEHGTWPASVADLDPAACPGFAGVPTGRAEDFPQWRLPYGPFACGMLPGDEARAREFAARYFDRTGLGTYSLQVTTTEEGLYKAVAEVAPGFGAGERTLAWLRQSLLALPNGYVRDVHIDARAESPFGQTLYYADTFGPGMQLLREHLAWVPVTDEELMEAGRRSAVQLGRGNVPSNWNDELLGPLPDYGDVDAPVGQQHTAYRIELTIALPAQVFAIWSVGPDGIDQGGEMRARPLHDLAPESDIVIFPGGL